MVKKNKNNHDTKQSLRLFNITVETMFICVLKKYLA